MTRSRPRSDDRTPGTGPSPLTRGIHAAVRGHRRRHGSIPAHAGDPSPPRSRQNATAVHPRSRGGSLAGPTLRGRCCGPSPLTRGIPEVVYCAGALVRSIPAHAGDPPRARPSIGRRPVHPRSRGGSPRSRRASICAKGPSPLTRGILQDQMRRVRTAGSIPAHAGDQNCYASSGRRAGVHPRSRGGSGVQRTNSVMVRGPSPLTRGIPEWYGLSERVERSIPAHAGDPSSKALLVKRGGVHPRSRGGSGGELASAVAGAGPSPLTRGIPERSRCGRSRCRSIPAHAGDPPRGAARS